MQPHNLAIASLTQGVSLGSALGAWVSIQFCELKPLIGRSYLSTSDVPAALRRFCGEGVLRFDSSTQY